MRNPKPPKLALLVLLLSTMVATAAAADAEKLGKIPARMKQFVAEHKISGAVTLVARDGQVIHLAAVGYSDIQKKMPMKPDSIFAIASMTKPITATAVMLLQDDGLLSIDDPVARFLPEFKKVTLQDGCLPKRPITIRDLLSHTSGVVGSRRNEGSLEDTVELLAKRPLAFQPGERWEYSPGLTVCGRVVEVVAKMPFEQFLAQRIFQPLKMTDTTFYPNREQQERIVCLYKPGEDKQSLEITTHWINDLSEGRTTNPSGGLFSTAADLSRFYQMVLNGGELDGQRLLSSSAVKQMTTLQTGDLQVFSADSYGWGLGWALIRKPQGMSKSLSPGTFGHSGAFGTQGWVDPKRKMILVLLIQRIDFPASDQSSIPAAFFDLAVTAEK